VDLRILEEVPETGLVVAGAEGGIGIHRHLEGPHGKRGTLRAQARGGIREPGLEAARRLAKGGVAHDGEVYLAGGWPRRMFGMTNTAKPPVTTGSSPAGGGERRPLDRAPGDRYATEQGGTGAGSGSGSKAPLPGGRRTRALVAAVIVADLGAVLFFLLGLLDLGPGLIVVAAFTGWVTALALVWWGRPAGLPVMRTRVAVAAFLGGWAVVAGILIDWVYGLAQGGVLGPIDYVGQRYGFAVALLCLVVGAGVAALRAR